MFKKSFTVQAQHLLSKKVLKKFKGQIVEQFPALEEKVLDQVLPNDQVKVLQLDNGCLLYHVGDGSPLFIDVEARGELFPTLQMLWQHLDIMQEVTIHPQVSHYVVNGADLMLPGIIVPANGIQGMGSVTKGQKRCIKIEGNPFPIAVGKMLVNQAQFEKLKGKGLEVCHVFRDCLWAHSGRQIPNAGFTEKEGEVCPCADMSYTPGAPPAVEAPQAAEVSSAKLQLHWMGHDCRLDYCNNDGPCRFFFPFRSVQSHQGYNYEMKRVAHMRRHFQDDAWIASPCFDALVRGATGVQVQLFDPIRGGRLGGLYALKYVAKSELATKLETVHEDDTEVVRYLKDRRCKYCIGR